MRNNIFGVIALLSLISFAHAGEPPHGTHEFALALRPVASRIRAGTVPKFRLTLTNITRHACRVLNIERRVDLQHTYFDLIVTQGGKPIQVERVISDPGPVSDGDWLQIPRSTSKTFTLASFPQRYEKLAPGAYEAYVIFWPDPFQSRENAYRSKTARFTVAN